MGRRKAPAEKALPKLEEQLCFALYNASRAVTGAYAEQLAALGITYPQYLALLTLWEEDGQSVSRLGQRLFLDSATLTPLLKRLEMRGFVERRRSKQDERVVELFLTPAGKRLEARAAAVPAAVFCKAQLSVTELAHLRSTLRALTTSLRHSARKTA